VAQASNVRPERVLCCCSDTDVDFEPLLDPLQQATALLCLKILSCQSAFRLCVLLFCRYVTSDPVAGEEGLFGGKHHPFLKGKVLLVGKVVMVIVDDDFIQLPAGAAGWFCANCPPKCVGEPPRFEPLRLDFPQNKTCSMHLTGPLVLNRQAAKCRGQEPRATAVVRCMRPEVRRFPLFLEDMCLLGFFFPVSLFDIYGPSDASTFGVLACQAKS
jgi:hypothetical protein